MEKYVIEGGHPLSGEVTISGAKNAAVAILPATILANGLCTIENLPNISDVAASVKILSQMGAQVRMLNAHTLEINTANITSTVVPDELSRQMRASYYFLGALLGRFGEGTVSMPGGCNLGPRPVDQHLKAFAALGSEEKVEYGMINVKASHLVGDHFFFDTVSVGATINAMLAAVSAEGMTVLENVAKEPHIVDVANFLNTLGADIRGAGTDVIKIRGTKNMHGGTYSIIPDQIEAGTYMAASVITGGDILIKNIIPKHLEPISDKFEKIGANIEEYDDSLRISCKNKQRLATNIKTMPHPGFPTDMQPIITAVLSISSGTSIVTEGIWENRFRYTEELIRMGANIQVDGRVAVVEGVESLNAAPMQAADLRAGAALIVAALGASGVSEIEEIVHIERGYELLVEKITNLGGAIKRISIPTKVMRAAL